MKRTNEKNKMSISTSSEYKSMRKSQSLPHIASRHDSGVSGITTTTILGPGSCSLLDQIDYDSNICNEHQFNNGTNHNQYHNHLRHYNNGKCNNHNYHHHNHHQQYENVREMFHLIPF